MLVPCANPKPERGGRIQAADETPRSVEGDLNVAVRQVDPLTIGEQLYLVGLSARDIVPLQVGTANEYGDSRRSVRRVRSTVLSRHGQADEYQRSERSH